MTFFSGHQISSAFFSRTAHILDVWPASSAAEAERNGISPDAPPSCNTGGTQSTPTPSGASKNGSPPQGPKTIIDTIAWTIPETTKNCTMMFDNLVRVKALVLRLFPDGCSWGEPSSGTKGFAEQSQLLNGSLILGWMQVGAQHGRLWLYLTGVGLRFRRDHSLSDDDLVEIFDLSGARLTRCDIALDLYDHSIFSVEKSLRAYEAGLYKLPRAPQSPHQEIFQSDSGNPEYPAARTHYLGKRDANKRLRVYDKGLQVMGTMTPDELADAYDNGIIRAGSLGDARLEEWTRIELVYTHDKRCPLNRAMIPDRDEYFAGAYPLLAQLLGCSDGKRPSYIPRDEDVEQAKLEINCRESYGGLIFYQRYERGYDDATIVERLIGEKAAARLRVSRERPTGGEHFA